MNLKSLFLIASLAAATAHAEDKVSRAGTLPGFLQQFDTNEDGLIDEEEHQAIREYRQKLREERRNSIDTDDDGKISREEIQAAREEIRNKIEDRRREHFSKIAGEDDLINSEEFLTIPSMARLPEFIREALFSRLDSDDSGDISSEEFLNRLRSHRAPRRHARR